MEITSLYFLMFLIVSILIYYKIGQKYKVLFLTFLSCIFICTYSIYLFIYIVLYSLINYYIGNRIPFSKSRKILFRIGILTNLFQLLLLKYGSFAINPIFEVVFSSTNLYVASEFIIPLGISYFTLQGIGYLINIYMGWEKPEKNFLNVLLYICFFPRFLSGPIDRSNEFLPQLSGQHVFDHQKVIEGLRLVLFGLFKKVIIANQLASVISSVYSNIITTDEYCLLIIMLIQPLYLYFDFSGYSDIAIGAARAFGIELRANFNRPFMSENMTMFWKRFHMSLSSWFHDYVFMRALFRFRKWTKYASVISLFLTWAVFGIWHGKGWNYLLLGLLQGSVIYYEFLTKKWRMRLFSRMQTIYRVWIGRIITYIYFSISLVFLFAPDVKSAITFFSRMNKTSQIWPIGIWNEIFILLLVIGFGVFEILRANNRYTYIRIRNFWHYNKVWSVLFRWILYFILITLVIVFNNDVHQFIYYQY